MPFENLSIHLGEKIELADRALVEKVVTRHRGGFCYEINGAFAALLSALGFSVTLLAARVLLDPARMGAPFDHLVLRVDTPEPWLVDVGFGTFSHHPLRLDLRGEQRDPDGTFRIVDVGDGDVDVLRDGRPQYRIEDRPRALADFEPTCWWHQTSPKSHFTRALTCSRLTAQGRITLSGRRLIRTSPGHRHEAELTSDHDVLAAYESHFGITLDRVPTVGSVA